MMCTLAPCAYLERQEQRALTKGASSKELGGCRRDQAGDLEFCSLPYAPSRSKVMVISLWMRIMCLYVWSPTWPECHGHEWHAVLHKRA